MSVPQWGRGKGPDWLSVRVLLVFSNGSTRETLLFILQREQGLQDEIWARRSRGDDCHTIAPPCHGLSGVSRGSTSSPSEVKVSIDVHMAHGGFHKHRGFSVRLGKLSKSLLVPWPGVGLEKAHLKTTFRCSGLVYLLMILTHKKAICLHLFNMLLSVCPPSPGCCVMHW